MTIHRKAVKQYFAVVLFIFRFSPVGEFRTDTLSSEMVNAFRNDFESFSALSMWILEVVLH